MTTGHLAWVFVPTDTTLSELLHFFARMTIPLACFLVVQGYYLSKDIWGYARRLFGFALLAQVPFVLAFYDWFGDDGIFNNLHYFLDYGNVLFTLGVGLLSVITLDKIRHSNTPQKFIYLTLLPILALCATWSDWGMLVIFWVCAIFYRGALGFLAVSIGLFVWSFLLQDATHITPYITTLQTNSLMDYGIFVTVPIMLWYQNNKQNSPTHYRLPRLLFYWYYIGHLVVIGLVSGLIEYTKIS